MLQLVCHQMRLHFRVLKCYTNIQQYAEHDALLKSSMISCLKLLGVLHNAFKITDTEQATETALSCQCSN